MPMQSVQIKPEANGHIEYRAQVSDDNDLAEFCSQKLSYSKAHSLPSCQLPMNKSILGVSFALQDHEFMKVESAYYVLK